MAKERATARIQWLENSLNVSGMQNMRLVDGKRDLKPFKLATKSNDLTMLLELDKLNPLSRRDGSRLVTYAGRLVEVTKPEIISWLMTVDDISKRRKLRFHNVEMARAFFDPGEVCANHMTSSERIVYFETTNKTLLRDKLCVRMRNGEALQWLKDAAAAGVDFDVAVYDGGIGETLLEKALASGHPEYDDVVAPETTILRDSKGKDFKSQLSLIQQASVRRASTLRHIQALDTTSVVKAELLKLIKARTGTRASPSP